MRMKCFLDSPFLTHFRTWHLEIREVFFPKFQSQKLLEPCFSGGNVNEEQKAQKQRDGSSDAVPG
jgi:hypothetical protein